MILALNYRCGNLLLAELDPMHFISQNKRVYSKMRAYNEFAYPIEAVQNNEQLILTDEEYAKATEKWTRYLDASAKAAVKKHLAGQHDQSTHGKGGSGVKKITLDDIREEVSKTWADPKNPTSLESMFLEQRLAREKLRTIYEKNGIRLAINNETAEARKITPEQINTILDLGRQGVDAMPTSAKNRLADIRANAANGYAPSDALITIGKVDEWNYPIGAVAATEIGHLPPEISLSPRAAEWDTLWQPHTNFGEQAFGKASVLESTIHHEIGHAIDTPDNVSSVRIYNQIINGSGMMTFYGKSSPREAFAEAYASYIISGKKITNPWSQVYVKTFGWDK